LLLSGIGFLVGLITGSYAVWAVTDIELGRPVPLASMLHTLLMKVGLCCLMVKCFDWDHESCTADDE
jgi:hypothetical protein